MKLNDAVWGALLVLLAGAILVHVQSFPRIPGQSVGPGLFPGTIATGLGICGLGLVIRGVRARAARSDGSAWFVLPEWLRSRPHALSFAVLVAINLFYLLAVDKLGFVLTGFVYLAALMAVLRVPLVRALAIALVMTLAIHYAFYKLLRVPLPWGILQFVAW